MALHIPSPQYTNTWACDYRTRLSSAGTGSQVKIINTPLLFEFQ